mmetsp:Transcript_38747/g.97602  ORF Transcript_38747/g.97602 Transcript_38747/m.97602 type:complete len:535 (-) Transcript_38747:434-2038(-)|eukprot:CAMPEP_0177646428 /NCGR_PEP_ID=MMETSP0447-20121125/9769_1 /TAXON_ID=0 /ORGANISM="Stygamoeba regulata, Strain BSH-02190019" /LENGTH=534 /DNA_ID=CAMNT_0019148961 /DNA_START=95 /DNA_END=1699 /DNA_ORIENTATION=+
MSASSSSKLRLSAEMPPFIEKPVLGVTNRTKIVCTLGPASSSPEVLAKMITAGMDVCRLNFSHGSHEGHRKMFNLVRHISAQHEHQVSILADIQGPKIRCGKMEKPFQPAIGSTIKVTAEEVIGTPERFTITYSTIVKDLVKGDLIFVNDGVVRLRVQSKTDTDLICVVEATGTISDNKGCNIPSGQLSLSVVTEKDAEDLVLIAELAPEYLATSFVGTADDIHEVRSHLHKHGNFTTKIIAKIERPVALENIDAIIAASDGIMVARGDLGVEIPPEEVPAAQKSMVKKCNKEGRPVIVATQMLESMINTARPTRAEASDVFNAVLDGADAVMLSAESSVGNYPIESVSVMDDIVGLAEKYLAKRDPNDYDSASQGLVETMGHATKTLAEEFGDLNWDGVILSLTYTGVSTRMISKYRPGMNIYAVTPNLQTARELNLVWGVRSIYAPELEGENLEHLALRAISIVAEMGVVKIGDHVVVTSASLYGDCELGCMSGIYNVEQALKMWDLAKKGALKPHPRVRNALQQGKPPGSK